MNKQTNNMPNIMDMTQLQNQVEIQRQQHQQHNHNKSSAQKPNFSANIPSLD